MDIADHSFDASGEEKTLHEVTIDYTLINKLVKKWPRRATVRSEEYDLLEGSPLETQWKDYPPAFVPFWDHPHFAILDQQLKDKVLTLAWIIYNQRTITTEENFANPAFALVFQNRLPGVEHLAIKQAMQQSLVDEHFHTLLHLTAVAKTKTLRGMEDFPDFPYSVTYRDYLEVRATTSEGWQRNLLLFTYALVSEVSINAFLDIIASDKGVQPVHVTVTRLHGLDESVHGPLFIELAKCVYHRLNTMQRNFFIEKLPLALNAFLRQDYSAWELVLDYLEVPRAREILADCKATKKNEHLSRDYSGLRKLADELDITHRLSFHFQDDSCG